MSSDADSSVVALTAILGQIRDLLRSNLQTSNSSHASISAFEKLLIRLIDNQRSGATDRLDAQAVEDARQQRQIDMMELNVGRVINRMETLTRMVEEQHRWSMPWWVRLQRRIRARRDWVERRK